MTEIIIVRAYDEEMPWGEPIKMSRKTEPVKPLYVKQFILLLLAVAVAVGCYSYKAAGRVFHNGQWYDRAEYERMKR